jgi:hypothetical protein
VRVALTGVLLTVVVTGILYLVWGRVAVVPGVAFGLVATLIQVAAWLAVAPVLSGAPSKFLARWAIGMGLRLAGVLLVAVAIVIDRSLFAPLPTAFGYLGVVIPLLFLELRSLR